MHTKDAYKLLETLLDGINPITGEVLPENHLCQEPDVIRALHKALMALRATDVQETDETPDADSEYANKNGRLNAGRPWTQKDLDWLKQLYEANASMEEMCHLLQRRKRGVEKQLTYLGLMETKNERPASNGRYLRAGQPWTADEDKTLWDMWKRGDSRDQIAKVLQRSTYAILCRMERCGMLNPEDVDA